MSAALKAPFPWFGGKTKVASLVWQRFGECRSFVEPFFGSGAVLLGRPSPQGIETVNDADGLVSNFWRAVRSDPAGVAYHADWPVSENDLHARHAWLVARKDSLAPLLEGDPDYFDAKVAGWWCWGMACWIGSGFCSGDGPWQVVEANDGSRKLVHLSNAGRGVNRKRVHLSNAGQGVNRKRVHLSNAGQGVNRKRVHLSNAGQGVNRQRVHLGDAGRGVNRKRVHLGDAGHGVNRKRVHLGNTGQGNAGLGECGLLAWMQALADRLQRVRVCCGDWRRVCGGNSGNALRHLVQQTPCAVFLDPPYSHDERNSKLYRVEKSVADDVREWAVEHGVDPRFRIALCGYEGEHTMPRRWACVPWKAHGGYGNQSKAGDGRDNAHRERIWFSPHCVKIKAAKRRELFEVVA